jgi:hypothetical protein
MNWFPKPMQTVFFEKLSISAAFGNSFMWLLSVFRNPFVRALAAFGESSRNEVEKLFQKEE